MDDESGSRLAAILKNVITTEINLRTADLTTTEQNINAVREYLNRTRQGVCADFYDDNFKTTLQKPAHRAVKNTFAGKAPIKQKSVDTDHFTHSSSSRWSSETQSIKGKKVNYENCETLKEEPPDLEDTDGLKQENIDAPQPKYLDSDDKLNLSSDVEKRRPRYIPPVIPVTHIQHSLKPRGNKTMKKVRFLVRNNSKYILTPEDSSGATHKWSLNVKLNDESVDISHIVSKVVFYLHPSYKPHDVVTVNSAPFKITRRGWGEFDLRIKIFFLNEKNEPVAVTHPLVFDKFHSGMETFGGETIFDHWINEPSEPTDVNPVDRTLSSKGDELTLSNRTEQPITFEATSLPTLPSTTFDGLSTMPFTDETSKHFLSAIFGEPEELSAAKKDWEQFDSLFNLDDLAFPEFFGFSVNDPKSSTPGKSGGGDSQLGLPKAEATPGNVTDTVLDEKSGVKQSISAVTSSLQDDGMSSGKNKDPVQVDSSATDSTATVESTCAIGEALTSIPQSLSVQLSSNIVTSIGESSLQNRDCDVSSGPVEKELYLSDLSEFGDEVIIMDSNDGAMDQSDVQPVDRVEADISTQGKHLQICEGVDYSSMEMDDLIKFPSDKPSSSEAQPQKKITSSCGSSPVYMVATSKASAASPKKPRRSSGVVKASPQSVLKTGGNLVTTPRTTLLVSSANLSSIMSNKCVTNSPPTTLVVSSSNLSSIITSKCITNNPPRTLLVSSSNLPSTISPKCHPTSTAAHQKTSAKNSNRTVVRKVAAPRNPSTNIVSSISTIAKGGPLVNLPSTSRAPLQGSLAVPMKSAVTTGNPVAITTGGQPITLLSVINTSSANMPVSKTTPIVISSPRVGSQGAPTLLVPSSMILKQTLNKTVSNASVGQLNKTVLPQAIPLATKGNKLIANVMKMSTTQVGVRPGGTRFLVKMPDGTLKPINLESLTPLKPSELKMANPVASSSRSQVLVPQPVLLRPPLAASVVPAATRPPPLIGISPRGKTSPTYMIPAKKRKTEPRAATSSGNVRAQRAPIILSASSQVVFKLPRSPNQLPVVPQAANQSVIRLQSPQEKPNPNPIPILNEKAVSQLRKPAANPELPSNLIQKPEGMSILKRTPPETEVDARSLIEQCPRYSTEVSICWLLRKFPLVHGRAGEESFKQAFPYCAVNTTQFNQWPLAKRRAHELLRANDVFRVAGQIYPSFEWTKLDVVKFARLRGFTPLVGKINPSVHIHKLPVIEDRASLPDTEKLSKLMASYQEDTEDIDVTCIEEDESRCNVQPSTQTKGHGGKMFMTLKGQLEDAKVVEQWVETVSIYPEPEEIEPGVMFPAALRVLVSAFHSFAEDLIRRSYSSSYLRHNSMEPHNVASEDVQLALFSRKEFDLFTKQGFGTGKGSKTPIKIEEPSDNKS